MFLNELYLSFNLQTLNALSLDLCHCPGLFISYYICPSLFFSVSLCVSLSLLSGSPSLSFSFQYYSPTLRAIMKYIEINSWIRKHERLFLAAMVTVSCSESPMYKTEPYAAILNILGLHFQVILKIMLKKMCLQAILLGRHSISTAFSNV